MVISGTELARQIHREIQRDVEELVAQGNMRPHLGVILVGDDPASHTYVKNKTRAATILGQIWAVCVFLNTFLTVYGAVMHMHLIKFEYTISVILFEYLHTEYV